MGILGHGVYNLAEAAKLTRQKPQRVREWLSEEAAGPARQPDFRSDYPPVDGDRAISFHDLIEVFVAGHLRDRGVSLQALRRLHLKLQTTLRTGHPFCRYELLVRGAEVFTIGLDDPDETTMIDVLSHQRVFPEILLPFLRQLDYDEATNMARRWQITDQIVIDPAIGLGKPIIHGIGIATAVLAASYQANEQDADLVADWFRVHPKHVIAAVAFERSLAA